MPREPSAEQRVKISSNGPKGARSEKTRDCSPAQTPASTRERARRPPKVRHTLSIIIGALPPNMSRNARRSEKSRALRGHAKTSTRRREDARRPNSGTRLPNPFGPSGPSVCSKEGRAQKGVSAPTVSRRRRRGPERAWTMPKVRHEPSIIFGALPNPSEAFSQRRRARRLARPSAERHDERRRMRQRQPKAVDTIWRSR